MEDKSNFAFLQLRMNCPTLQTVVVIGTGNVMKWCNGRWSTAETNTTTKNEGDTIFKLSSDNPDNTTSPGPNPSPQNDWWILKASRGNGGKDIWILNHTNYKNVLSALNTSEISSKEEYVVQRSVCRG